MEKTNLKNPTMSVQPVSGWQSPNNHIQTLLTDPWYNSIAQVLACILNASHNFFASQKIKPLLFPITTGSVSSPMGKGSDSLPVKINLRGNNVYLADSMQFSLEIGTRLLKDGCYYIMPTFRGEKLDDRHLNEFFHAEAEIKGELGDVMSLIERYMYALAKALRTELHEEIFNIAGTLSHIDDFLASPQKYFKRVRYDEALELLKNMPNTVEITQTGQPNITREGERVLMDKYGDFTWLTHMPWANVPFYQAQETGTEYALNADLLAGIGEIVGCGQRVFSSEDLKKSLAAHDVSVSGYEWYDQMRKVNAVQTSGFGLGIERFILWATKTTDIRDCMLLIRDHEKVCLP